MNRQALALEEAETQIRLTVKEEYLKGSALADISKKIEIIIKTALKEVKIESLRLSAQISLNNFYRRQYSQLSKIPRYVLLTASFFASYQAGNKKPSSAQISALRRQGISLNGANVVTDANFYGVPLKKFSKDYFNHNVKPVYDRLVNQYPFDPNDNTKRNSLRNLAEMEVRYQAHEQQIEDFKAQGVRLVIASTHADCSKRCAKWQGRVYSLDGTYGTTDDGRKYVPLEVATRSAEVIYTTKAGKTYYNGLLGFNCRHFLVPYKSGYRFPKPNVSEERKQYAITLKQRQLERQVRKWRTEAVMLKNVDREKYLSARQKAIDWNNEYIDFSRRNERAFYPSRTEII